MRCLATGKEILLLGSGGSSIVTLVERTSRFVILIRLSRGRGSEEVLAALKRRIVTLPTQLCRSLTWDQGKEMAQHARFTVETGLQVYFCDPQSPWQRGTNENTNGLLRQYFPKFTSLAGFSQRQLDAVAAELNGRPRQTLGWMTPSENRRGCCDDRLTSSCGICGRLGLRSGRIHVRSKESAMLVQVVTFNLEGMSDAEFRAACEEQWCSVVAATPGLLSKTWLANSETNTYGGVYLWPDRDAMERYVTSDLFRGFTADPRIVGIHSESFSVLEELSRATNGLGVPVA